MPCARFGVCSYPNVHLFDDQLVTRRLCQRLHPQIDNMDGFIYQRLPKGTRHLKIIRSSHDPDIAVSGSLQVHDHE
jgi:hypothetical protein